MDDARVVPAADRVAEPGEEGADLVTAQRTSAAEDRGEIGGPGALDAPVHAVIIPRNRWATMVYQRGMTPPVTMGAPALRVTAPRASTVVAGLAALAACAAPARSSGRSTS